MSAQSRVDMAEYLAYALAVEYILIASVCASLLRVTVDLIFENAPYRSKTPLAIWLGCGVGGVVAYFFGNGAHQADSGYHAAHFAGVTYLASNYELAFAWLEVVGVLLVLLALWRLRAYLYLRLYLREQ